MSRQNATKKAHNKNAKKTKTTITFFHKAQDTQANRALQGGTMKQDENDAYSV
jgi:hypothetical protein